MPRQDWLYGPIHPHTHHDLIADPSGQLQCLTCSQTVASRVEVLVPHAGHPLTVAPSEQPDERTFVDTIRCTECGDDVLAAATLLYSMAVADTSD